VCPFRLPSSASLHERLTWLFLFCFLRTPVPTSVFPGRIRPAVAPLLIAGATTVVFISSAAVATTTVNSIVNSTQGGPACKHLSTADANSEAGLLHVNQYRQYRVLRVRRRRGCQPGGNGKRDSRRPDVSNVCRASPGNHQRLAACLVTPRSGPTCAFTHPHPHTLTLTSQSRFDERKTANQANSFVSFGGGTKWLFCGGQLYSGCSSGRRLALTP